MSRVKNSIHIARIYRSIKNLEKIGAIENSKLGYILTNTAQLMFPIHENKEHSPDEMDKLLTWSYDIGDKQYRSYSWNDAKVQCLLTVDAALIAGILFILQLLNAGNGIIIEGLPIILYFSAFICLSISLILCLLHSIPKLNSKIGNEANLRTIIGISRFSTIEKALGKESGFIAKEEYCKSVMNLSIDDLVKMNLQQIAGMSKNNNESYKTIRKGAIFTIVSVVFIIVGTVALAFQTIFNVQILSLIIIQSGGKL